MIEKKHKVKYLCEWFINVDNYPVPVLLFWNKQTYPNGSNWLAIVPSKNKSGKYSMHDGIDATRIPILHTVSLEGELVSPIFGRESMDGSLQVSNGKIVPVKKAYNQMKFWVMPSEGKLEIVDDSIGILLSQRDGIHANR